MAILALFAASLQFFMGNGGLVSFGHAAYFGLGAYAAAMLVASRLGAPFAAALLAAPLVAGARAALAASFFVLRAQGVYASMLTLAFAQILWSIAVQWVDVTGGDNGMLGVWPPTTSRLAYYLHHTGRSSQPRSCMLRRAALAPFGYALRATRDAPERAEALGIDVRRVRWTAFVAGLRSAVWRARCRRSRRAPCFRTRLSIPLSVDALVMVLLGGLQTLSGPIVGAIAYHGLATELIRHAEYWRLHCSASTIVAARDRLSAGHRRLRCARRAAQSR